MSDTVEGWSEPKKPFKPGSEPTVKVIGQKPATTKASSTSSSKSKDITPTKAKKLITEGFGYVGMFTGCAEVWLLESEEAEKLANPTAKVYNALPDKFKIASGEQTGNIALVLAVIMLTKAVNDVVAPRLAMTMMMKKNPGLFDLEVTPQQEDNVTDAFAKFRTA